MYSEFHQFTSLGMSKPQNLVLIKEDEEEEGEEKESKFITSQNPDGLEEIAPKNPSSIQEDWLEEKEDFDADHVKEDKRGETSGSSTESEKPCLLVGASTTEVADDDEGFRTPTSSDHKIPVITRCPPAPKKSRTNPSATSKRKRSPTTIRPTFHLDLSTEIESMFPPTIQDDDDDDDDDDDIDCKIKKARK